LHQRLKTFKRKFPGILDFEDTKYIENTSYILYAKNISYHPEKS
jgi:hypothetical protein